MEDHSDSDLIFPYGTRLEPIGAPTDSEETTSTTSAGVTANSKCHHQEEEDFLSASFFSLTTHLAQIQFRLRQIINAPSEEREELLESLEEFSSKELPDLHESNESQIDNFVASYIASRYAKQNKLLNVLRSALSNLKSDWHISASQDYDVDALSQKLKILVNDLSRRIPMKIDENNCLTMTPTALKQKLNEAFGEMTKALEERKIIIDNNSRKMEELAVLEKSREVNVEVTAVSCLPSVNKIERDQNEISNEPGIIDKLYALIRMLLRVYIGCGFYERGKGRTGENVPQNHWGNLRAKLQMAIMRVRKVGERQKRDGNNAGYRKEMTSAVLNCLAPGIKDLMQHGLVPAEPDPVSPAMFCIPRIPINTHAWRILVSYYIMKNGDQLRLSPARKLSQSFNLDIAEASPANDHEHLLLTIDQIISLYRTYKRNSDVHFKAFICAALNAKKLATWLNMIFQCDALIKFHYLPWSYVAKTRFRDSLVSLDVLSETSFDLPVDFAIRKFLNMRDMFI